MKISINKVLMSIIYKTMIFVPLGMDLPSRFSFIIILENPHDQPQLELEV